jgi:hypothetical protein
MFLNSLGNILGKQILFPQQCFHGWANRETFEETSRITNVSTTMFPSLPRALFSRVHGNKLTIFPCQRASFQSKQASGWTQGKFDKWTLRNSMIFANKMRQHSLQTSNKICQGKLVDHEKVNLCTHQKVNLSKKLAHLYGALNAWFHCSDNVSIEWDKGDQAI